MAVAGLYLLGNFKMLFRRYIRHELLRQNVVAFLAIFCFIMATAPMNEYFIHMLSGEGIIHVLIGELIAALINVLFVYNIVRLVVRSFWLKRLSLTKQWTIILIVLIVTTVIVNFPLNYFGGNLEKEPESLKYSVIVNIYMAGVIGMVYILMHYIDTERNRKMQEKELELARMNELKTKAELDALHSKVNPHFLYNALNSIADLSVTDGKKARKMTIALADLFRYSINYTQNNFAAIKDEVAMTEVYLQIEKIRFEDQLNYTLHVDDELNYYLVPRFILQSLVENAVKHGLKITRQMTEIVLEVKRHGTGMVINIADNGPAFPDELLPGYGIKSVYDKLDLLFPGQYEVHFTNQPRKQVAVYLFKLIKNEPAL
jgi:sensor histidine kinase YesM